MSNENVYRFLAIYQTIGSALIGGGVALFVGYRQWGITASLARSGLIALLFMVTIIGVFTILLISMAILNWLDYREEECELTDAAVFPGFRKRPRLKNFLRWYETYLILFIVISTAALWILAFWAIFPGMKLLFA